MHEHMKHLLSASGMLRIYLLMPLLLFANQPATSQSDSLPNAEPSHAHFTLADNREIQLVLNRETGHELSYSTEFEFAPQWRGSQVFIKLSGLAGPFRFRINNFLLSSGEGDLSPVEFNLTPFLNDRTNRAVVIFDHSTDSMEIPGLRDAALVIREPVHVRDLQISTHPGGSNSETLLRVHLHIISYLTSQEPGRSLSVIISDTAGNPVIKEKRELTSPLAFRQEVELAFDQIIENPCLWSPDHPCLYKLQLHLLEDGKLRGELLSSNFGISDIQMKDSILVIDKDTILPVIANPELMNRLTEQSDAQILSFFKDNGYTAVLSNDPLPARVMDLFDRHGILVLRKQVEFQALPDRSDINRPSLIWIE